VEVGLPPLSILSHLFFLKKTECITYVCRIVRCWWLQAAGGGGLGGLRRRWATQLTGDARTRAPDLGFRWKQLENEA
jgi:hypothetical protein